MSAKVQKSWFWNKKYRSQYCVYRKLDIDDDVLLEFTDKVQNVRIDLDGKKVYVTSSELSADELLECIKKTGKTTNYIGLAANWRSRQNMSVHPFCLPACPPPTAMRFGPSSFVIQRNDFFYFDINFYSFSNYM